MWLSLISGLLGQNEQNTNQQKSNGLQERQDVLQKRLSQQQAQQMPVSGSHIDLDSIINGVFTKGKQQRNNSIPSGYLGV